MKQIKQSLLTLVLVLMSAISYGQVTTSTISGVVKDNTGEVLVGATVYATQRDENGQTILARDTFSRNSSVFDVWTAQATLRYTFGR